MDDTQDLLNPWTEMIEKKNTVIAKKWFTGKNKTEIKYASLLLAEVK